jgi:outer membrane protein OmpA-like peptidoglycan-associated protein
MRKLITILALAALVAACRKHETAAPAATSSSAATTSSAATPAAATATAPGAIGRDAQDLLALTTGAVVVQKPQTIDRNGEAWLLFDEDDRSGWCSNDSARTSGVLELAHRTLIKMLVFDLKMVEQDGRIPKDVVIEMSDTSATAGFKPILATTIPQKQEDGIQYATTADVPGRWLRFTVNGNYGGGGTPTQIMELRGYGKVLSNEPMPNVTGTYETDRAGTFHLKQDGASVTGCYDFGNEPLIGGMEGRLLKFEWSGKDSPTARGPAIMIFSGNGALFGGWWQASAEQPHLDAFEGKKTSDQPGDCPQWKAPEDALAKQIKETGRVRLYGINFDSDSDQIRGESKPTLDQVAAMLKQNAGWKITIEGHTDNTSTPEHNQQLSERRATAVKNYLTGAGIDAARLSATGFGATKPVATNDTPLGRAENRRVELVKG